MDDLLNKGNITFRMLKYFHVLAEELHFGRAAEKLFITQPPLSLQIKKLEDILGFQLFERNKNTVRLTKAGFTAYNETQKILNQLESSFNLISQAGRRQNNHIILGVISSVLQPWFFKALDEIHKKHPHLSWDIVERSPRHQQMDIKVGAIDLGITRGKPSKDPLIGAIELFEDYMGVVFSPKHQDKIGKSFSLKDLKEYKKITLLRKKGCPYLLETYKKAIQSGISPEQIIEFNEPYTEQALIRSNIVIGLLPYSLGQSQKDYMIACPLKEKIPCSLYLIHPAQVHGEGQKLFIQAMQNMGFSSLTS